MSKQFSIGPIVGMLLKTRYAALSAFIGKDFYPEKGMDVFIDLNTVVSALSTSTKFLNSLPFSSNAEADIIENILGVLKHWKDFTRKYDDVRIFMIVNDFEMKILAEQKELKSYLMPYVNKFDHERYSQMSYYWTEAMKRIEIILKYIPKSYLIRCNQFDSYVVPNIMDDYASSGRYRLIVTGNPLMTSYCLEPNTRVIYVRFKHQVTVPNMIVQAVSGIDDEIMNTFVQNKVFYNLLNAIVGDFDRGLIGISQIGIAKFSNDLLRAIERQEIPDNPKSIETILPVIYEGYHEYLRKSYPLVNIDLHSKLIPPSMVEKMKGDMIDMYDIDGLRSISVGELNLLELL